MADSSATDMQEPASSLVGGNKTLIDSKVVHDTDATNATAAKPTNTTVNPPTTTPQRSEPIWRTNFHHTNPVIEAGRVRARDEQDMQQWLQNLQYQYRIYNDDIEPEHETDYFYCDCAIHRYQRAKWERYGVQDMWAKAVMYPGEHSYNDNKFTGTTIFSRNPYSFRVVSPFGYGNNWMNYTGFNRPSPTWHARAVNQTISLNNSLNKSAQASVDGKEPKQSIWIDDVGVAMAGLSIDSQKDAAEGSGKTASNGKSTNEKRLSLMPVTEGKGEKSKSSRFSFRKSIRKMSTDQSSQGKLQKASKKETSLRDQILAEENGRWPDEQERALVQNYQEKVGMRTMIADLRARKPIQYLHLLRAGYFEPIPVAWANQMSNPLKFSIDGAAGWRGITPAWRGYEDTAEERLYWVLNHRAGSTGSRLKPDFISALKMANERMARAVEPPPLYYSADDVCHVQHTSTGYSKQVMPPPFQAFDRPERPSDDTMILLDVSGSMNFDPVRPVYDKYLIEGYVPSKQPRNKGQKP